MVSVCLCLSVHQPYRLQKFRVFDLGKDAPYFNDEENQRIFHRVAQKSYLPTNKILKTLIQESQGKFKCALVVSGVAIEQMAIYAPDVLESFQELAKTGCVEFLSSTYYQSLSSLYSRHEFKQQIQKHKEIIEKYFNQSPVIFRNTGSLYSDTIAEVISELGLRGAFIDASSLTSPKDWGYVYSSMSNLMLFPKHVNLSDDLVKRFSDQSWEEWPLTAEKYHDWISGIEGNGDIVNVVVPYEIFGEHHSEESGILSFVDAFPRALLTKTKHRFLVPSQVLTLHQPRKHLSIPSYAVESKLQGNLKEMWFGNDMQQDALQQLYEVEKELKILGDQHLLEDWRKLTTVDHLFFMNTVSFKTGKPTRFVMYESPYDAYLYFMNVLSDIKYRMNMKRVNLQKDNLFNKEEQPPQEGSVLASVRSVHKEF